MNHTRLCFRFCFSRSYLFLASGLLMVAMLAVLGFTSSVHAQTTPTVNGLFYGDGDNTRYSEYATSDQGSKLYSYLDAANERLYVAAVLSHTVNDMVCAEDKEAGPAANDKNEYVKSAGWTQGSGRNCKKPGDSEYLSFTFSCGSINYVWQQGMACPVDKNTAPQSGFVSDETCGTSTGTWPPSADIESSSSYVNNINTYQAQYPLPHTSVPWELYTPGQSYEQWKSPFLSSDPYDVTQVPGYPTFTTYNQLLAYNLLPANQPADKGWEWSMVYEWSLDVSNCADSSISFSPETAHHSPVKSGNANETWTTSSPDPLSDWGDLPEGVGLYDTTVAKNGPRHYITASGPRLGSLVDVETNGEPQTDALGDDTAGSADEDGVKFLKKFTRNSTVEVQVTITGGDGSANLSAWIDFDGDGVLEQLTLAVGGASVSDLALTNGVHTLTVNVPDVAIANSLAARFRLTDEGGQGGASTFGVADNGEIEDYVIKNTGTLPITLSYFNATVTSDDAIDFTWETATETGNAGFNLYVEEIDGNLSQINAQLIPSTVIDSVEAVYYSYRANAAGEVFFIEQIDISGQHEFKGPFALGEEYGVSSGLPDTPDGGAMSNGLYLPIVINR